MANIRKGLSRLAVVIAFIIALPLSGILTEHFYRTNTKIEYKVIKETKKGRNILDEIVETSTYLDKFAGLKGKEGKKDIFDGITNERTVERKVIDAEIPPPVWKVSLFAIACLLAILMLSYSAIMGSYFTIRWITKGFREAPP